MNHEYVVENPVEEIVAAEVYEETVVLSYAQRQKLETLALMRGEAPQPDRFSVSLGDIDSDAWMSEGRCAGQNNPEFSPINGAEADRAKGICAQCPVQPTCLEYALTYNIEHGVWGGASENERARMRYLRSRTT